MRCTWVFRWKNVFKRRRLRRLTCQLVLLVCFSNEFYCLDALRILLRCLKYENERKDARLQMLESKIIENDLIPILIHLDQKHDIKLIHHALK